MARINIAIDTIGNSKVDVEGGDGTSCKELTRAIEQALGGETKTDLKPEYHSGGGQTTKTQQTQRW